MDTLEKITPARVYRDSRRDITATHFYVQTERMKGALSGTISLHFQGLNTFERESLLAIIEEALQEECPR